ncbi:unnamed protein product [Agarophyton chilense]|eukprot:gb/GEZJ01004999.1/.p1 GENE.gb/GEZJ01004999.1/~~gb/GEZJ01004999.1/.p1  ORF type:complete len:379 (+),score=61.67 gb/GEZJ01004999.1/:1075-2211(+)
MTRTKSRKPGSGDGRGRKRKREESAVTAPDRAKYRQAHSSLSTSKKSPPPKNPPQPPSLSSDQKNDVEAVQAFVENEHAKLRTELKRLRKQVHREKTALKRKRESSETSGKKIAGIQPSKDEFDEQGIASNSVKEARTLERRSRRSQFEMQRAKTDEMIRTAPHQFLWSEYIKWAKEKDLDIHERNQWSSDQVIANTEDGQESLIPFVKKAIGSDYQKRTTFRKAKKATPGIAVIALAPSALRAVRIAPRLYDGQPVGKLFGKQKAEFQQQWLRRACRKTVVSTAVGTAKRVQRLLEDGHMTLEHTALIIIDFWRNPSLRNVLDFPFERNEIFQFLHDFSCARVTNGMKVMLTIPENQPVRLEDVTNDKQKQKATEET